MLENYFRKNSREEDAAQHEQIRQEIFGQYNVVRSTSPWRAVTPTMHMGWEIIAKVDAPPGRDERLLGWRFSTDKDSDRLYNVANLSVDGWNQKERERDRARKHEIYAQGVVVGVIVVLFAAQIFQAVVSRWSQGNNHPPRAVSPDNTERFLHGNLQVELSGLTRRECKNVLGIDFKQDGRIGVPVALLPGGPVSHVRIRKMQSGSYTISYIDNVDGEWILTGKMRVDASGNLIE